MIPLTELSLQRSSNNSAKQITIKHVEARAGIEGDKLPDLEMQGQGSSRITEHWFHYVVVYVRVGTDDVDEFKMDIHRSIGGQVAVFCPCSGKCNPLVVTGRRKEDLRVCMNCGCQRPEKYTCSRVGCATRICLSCFDTHATAGTDRVYLDPPPSGEVHPSQIHPQHHDMSDDGALGDDEESEASEPFSEDGSFYELAPMDGLGSDSDDESDDEIPDEESLPRHEPGPEELGAERDLGADSDQDSLSDGLCGLESDSQDEYWSEGDDKTDRPEGGSPLVPRQDDLREGEEDLDGNRSEHPSGEDDPEDIRPPVQQEEPRSSRILRSAGMEPFENVDHAMEHFHTFTLVNPEDEDLEDIDDGDSVTGEDDVRVPFTDAGEKSLKILRRDDANVSTSRRALGPLFVILNLFGALNTRRNKKIKGTQAQQSFVQRIVSRMRGRSVGLTYLAGGLLPRHFYLSAPYDSLAICGVLPVSTYRKGLNPDGFASHIQTARNLITLACSSTQNCHHLHYFLYSVLANQVSSGVHSRQIERSGFKVCHASPSGISVRDADESTLTESADSRQCVMDLAATAVVHPMDFFITLTLNQKMHPGVSHLHEWRSGMEWTEQVIDYDNLSHSHKEEAMKSFDMAYCCLVNRCWLEVRKELIEFITYRCVEMFGQDATHVFFRDEHQETTGAF